MRALSIASTGMLAQQTNVEVIANNLANMNTTAFKQQRAEFTDLLYQNIQMPGSQTSDQGSTSSTTGKRANGFLLLQMESSGNQLCRILVLS